MFREHGEWKWFDTELQLNQAADESGCRVRKINWTSPGWYFITHYSQKCLRGCCYDDVIEFVHKDDRIYEIKNKISSLVELLKSARERKG